MKRVLAFGMLLLLMLGCPQQAPQEPTVPEGPEVPKVPGPIVAENEVFSEGDFSIEYPSGWVVMENQLAEDSLLAADAYCALNVKKYGAVPAMLRAEIGRSFDAEWDGDIVEFDAEGEDGSVFHSRNRLVFCNCNTYLLGVGCLVGHFDESAADEIINSAECSWVRPPKQTGSGRTGMVIIPGEENEFMAQFCSAAEAVRESGGSVGHTYTSWGGVEYEPGEYDWEMLDYMMELNELYGFDMSLVISIIYTNQIGELPDEVGFNGFDDARLKEHFADYAIRVADRYENLEYLEIGNEVNIYLGEHPDEVDEFREFYSYVYDRVKERHPGLKVGTVFAYHYAKDTNTTYIIEELADVGDFNAFTLYIHGDKFAFNRSVEEAQEYFDGIDSVSPKPWAMTETGWSSSETLHSSEEKQAEYVEEVYSILEEKKGRVLFLTWFDSHDVGSGCEEAAESFITEGMTVDAEYLDYFEEFICTQGLRTADDEPKLGWGEWVEQNSEYAGVGQ